MGDDAMRVLRTSALALTALVASLSLTACDPVGGADAVDALPTNSAKPGAGGGSSAPDAAETPKDPGAGGEGRAKGTPCKTEDLSFDTQQLEDRKPGLLMIAVESSKPCELYGFAKVVAHSNYGSGPIDKSDEEPVPVEVAPGQTARIDIHYPPNTTGGSGVTYSNLTITPPDNTKSVTVDVGFNVGVDDDNGPITVDPIVAAGTPED
ncbi:DUF4232 domain-containing protein [Streptomyces spiralis]|nr:DUF4232 domain-containing protein [Streptomyces spiralis]